MDFAQKLQKITATNNSLLCVGLDPELPILKGPTLRKIMPKSQEKFKKGRILYNFNKRIIDQTAQLVCAYKPNIAFYEAEGIEGLTQLRLTIDYLKKSYPHIPIILDAKRADIPNTAKMYAKAVFDWWQADAVTVYPNLGLDSIEPFLEYKDKLTVLLLKTSNDDSKTFQNLKIKGAPYYRKMAEVIKSWKRKNIGIFVGATYPKELQDLRGLFPDKIFLSAGLGAQKGDIKKAVKAGIDKKGAGIMFNASRSIITSNNPKKEAEKLRDEINRYRK